MYSAIRPPVIQRRGPSQMRVLDSRSYLRMTSSTSAAIFCSVPAFAVAGVVLSGFLDKMHLSFFFLYDNYGREALP